MHGADVERGALKLPATCNIGAACANTRHQLRKEGIKHDGDVTLRFDASDLCG